MDDWSLEGNDAEIKKNKSAEEEIFTIEEPDKGIIDDLIEREKTGCFGRFLFKPNPNEVKVHGRSEITYIPYRVVEGIYTVTYLRFHNHSLQLENEVEAVKINENELIVNKEAFRLSGLIAKIGSGVSVGGTGINLSFGPFEGLIKDGVSSVLGDKDKKLSEKRTIEIPILEKVFCISHETICFDASSLNISINNDIWKEIKNQNPKLKGGRPKTFKENLSESKAIEELSKKTIRKPDDSKILKNQEFDIVRSQVYFVPIIKCKLTCKGETKELCINGLTLKVKK